MTITQPRRAKSSTALRGQLLSQQSKQKAPPLPNISISTIPSTPSVPSLASSCSTSSTSSCLRTPPQQESRPNVSRSPKEARGRKINSDITERLNSVANELESFVEESQSEEIDDSVHVAVRLKPTIGSEHREIWTADPVRGFISGKLGDFFFGIMRCLNMLTLDYVYTGEDTNYSVYEASVKKLVKKSVDGYHTTVFAYGQTSSGKTHTMRGHAEEAGIIPLAVADLFEEIATVLYRYQWRANSKQPTKYFTLKATYLEIYNEKVRDLLLDPSIPQSEEIKIILEKNVSLRPSYLTLGPSQSHATNRVQTYQTGRHTITPPPRRRSKDDRRHRIQQCILSISRCHENTNRITRSLTSRTHVRSGKVLFNMPDNRA